MAGEVLIENQKSSKVGQKVNIDSNISVLKKKVDYVSRGGNKLNKAILDFSISVKGKRAIDIGASTGGFTDCLLKHGAKEVYCIDVGYGQLAWKLQKDPRVVIMDRTNIRYLTPEKFEQLFGFATIDVSFISLEKVLPVVYHLLTIKGEVVALIKPQFEAGREYIQKGGIVRKPEVHQMVIKKVGNAALGLGFGIQGVTFSPLRRANGNIEYLIYFIKDSIVDKVQDFYKKAEEVVEKAHHVFSLK